MTSPRKEQHPTRKRERETIRLYAKNLNVQMIVQCTANADVAIRFCHRNLCVGPTGIAQHRRVLILHQSAKIDHADGIDELRERVKLSN